MTPGEVLLPPAEFVPSRRVELTKPSTTNAEAAAWVVAGLKAIVIAAPAASGFVTGAERITERTTPPAAASS